jgi:hypothetical protein
MPRSLRAHTRPCCHGPVTSSPRRSPTTASGRPYPLVVEAKVNFAFLFSPLSAMGSHPPPALLLEAPHHFSAKYCQPPPPTFLTTPLLLVATISRAYPLPHPIAKGKSAYPSLCSPRSAMFTAQPSMSNWGEPCFDFPMRWPSSRRWASNAQSTRVAASSARRTPPSTACLRLHPALLPPP